MTSIDEPKSFRDSSFEQAPMPLDPSNADVQPNLSEDRVADFYPTIPVSRTPTFLERVQSRYSFFNLSLKDQRRKLGLKILLIYLIMGTLLLATFSIYWGSMYKRNERLTNLKMLVVVEDSETIDGVDPYIGRSVVEVLQAPHVARLGGWTIYNRTEFAKEAAKHNNDIDTEVTRLVHQQDYWSAIHIKANATYNLYNAVKNGDTNYNVTENTIVATYETGRDFISVPNYITSALRIACGIWQEQYVGDVKMNITKQLQRENSSFSLQSDNLQVLTTALGFLYKDLTTYSNSVIMAPSQVGLIYMVIVTFFGFNFFADIHLQVVKLNVKVHHFMIYRVMASVLSWFVLSLFYSLVSLAMQISLSQTFGKSGFLVYWMTSFLTMWAVGPINEIMAMLFIISYPPLVGFWLLFWVIANISPTFTPIALTAKFYRYGYALPVHNSYEATKVIFFNTTKRHLGLNYAVLVIWVVLGTILLVPVSALFGKTMTKRAIEAKRKEKEAEAEALAAKGKDIEES